MAKNIITEADILAASARGEKRVGVRSGEDLVTPQARDTALALGVTLDDEQGDLCPTGSACPSVSTVRQESPLPRAVSSATVNPATNPANVSELASQVAESLRGKLPAGVDRAQVERLVREAVAARTARPAQNESAKAGSGIRDCGIVFVDGAKLLPGNAETAGVKEKVVLAEVFGGAGESKLAAGYLVWESASFNRVVDAPEVCVVIEGELRLTAGSETVVGKPGDMLYLPQGAKVIYSAPSRVKLACVGHHA